MSGLDVDFKQRIEAAKVLREKFLKIIDQIRKGKNPTLILPKRTLSNTIYDPEKGILLLGREVIARRFLNVGEARKFMQTLLMASIIYDALVNNEYPTIRDLFYRGKHTITYYDVKGRRRVENTWDVQSESDSVIRDIEVYTNLLREDMLILSKEKGKVVGNMKIRSGGDVIDLSKMGHGAYAIEPTPDLIEFLDVNAEYVLVVEKDAVFQQLHRAKFWEKNKAILITSAGQPDRATRRFVRRLNEEVGLPIYVLTDSIPGDEVVVVRDPVTGRVEVGPVEEAFKGYFSNASREWVRIPLEVPSWDPVTGVISWERAAYIYRHRVKDKILRIHVKGRGVVRVTRGHSLFVFRDGEVKVLPAEELRPDDYVVVAERLPWLARGCGEIQTLNVAKTIYHQLTPRQKASIIVGNNREVKRLSQTEYDELDKYEWIAHVKNKRRIPNKIKVDEEIAWIIGLLTAEGSMANNRYVISFSGEEELVRKVIDVAQRRLNINPYVYRNERSGETRIWLSSSILCKTFKRLGLEEPSAKRRIPSIILNSPPNVILAFLRGLIEGGGYLDRYGDIVYSTRSHVLSKQVVIILLSLGVNPSVTLNGNDIIIRIGKSTHRIQKPEIYRYLSGGRNPSDVKRISTEPTYGLPITRELRRTLIYLVNHYKVSYKPTLKTISKQKLKMLIKNYTIDLSQAYHTITEGHATLAKITKIEEEEYEGYVYDIAVPTYQSFLGSNGIILHNSDPYGWYIFSVFKVGSVTLSYESERLATPKARFLGVSMSDVFGVRRGRGWVRRPYLDEWERRNFLIKAKPTDVKRAKELKRYRWFQSREWRREIDVFLKKQYKVEIEALASKGLKFLAEKYIPEKLESGWIE